ncbi:MAG: nickel-dependent hydrogenase large subunit [Planctomycetota bacterium]
MQVTPKVITVDPVTRIEGHLKIKVKVEKVGGVLEVVDAWSTGTLFRGVEKILENRHPWDAAPITQRICGVCPVSHGMAAVRTMDAASGVTIPMNARVMRNLVLGSNFVSSHILHFYHLAALDYVQGPAMEPWETSWSSDLRLDPATSQLLIDHYLAALALRRKAHEAGALFGGRLPAPPAYIPGGFTENPTAQKIAAATAYLNELIPFIENVWIPDVQLLGTAYSDYFTIGSGHENLLAYGVFDLDASGSSKLFKGGRAEGGSTTIGTVNVNAISEDVTWSWYDSSSNPLHPSSGETTAQYPKAAAYSWLKAPRYANQPYEVGPLARMWVNGDYQNGISVMDRHMARAQEALKIAQAMLGWLTELQPGQPVFQSNAVPVSSTSYGLTEAPRGALGHWMKISNSKINKYQVVTPTCWNASPRDTAGVLGPIEQALIGTPVSKESEPVELLRVVHSFDPCLSCAVHVARPGKDATVIVHSRGGIRR